MHTSRPKEETDHPQAEEGLVRSGETHIRLEEQVGSSRGDAGRAFTPSLITFKKE